MIINFLILNLFNKIFLKIKSIIKNFKVIVRVSNMTTMNIVGKIK